MNNRTQFMKRFHLFSRRSNMNKIVQIGVTYMYFSWLLIFFFLSRKNVRIFDDNPFYLVCLKYNVQNTDDMQLVLNFLSGIDACDLWISFSKAVWLGDLRKQLFYLQTFVISLLLAVNEVRYTLLRFLLIYSIILNQGIVVNSLFYVYKGMILPISQILECTLLMLFVSIEDILCKGQIIIETHLISIFFF